MESTLDQDHDKSQSHKGFYEKGVILDPPDDIAKSETPELPQPFTELPISRRHSKPSFVLPSLDENSKAPTPPPSGPSSRRSSVSEFLGALPSHEQLRRFSIASTKTDHTDSSRTSPFQSGASSKVQSPLITGRKGSVSSLLKGETDTSPQHVEYQVDPFASLSLGPTAASAATAGQQKESTSATTVSGPASESYGHPDLSSFIEMASHSPYAYVPVSSYLPYSGLPYSVITPTPSPPPFYLTQLPSPRHDIARISPEVPKRHGRRKNKKRDSIKKSQVSTPEKDSQPLSQAPTPIRELSTPKASQSLPETKMGSTSPSQTAPMVVGNQQTSVEFDGFQDDYLEDSEYKYKTAICRSHLATGYCEYGPACQYAHGVQELRPRDFDVKFKTELCKNYHAMGMCWFGSRCRFIHDEYRLQAGENEFWLVAPSENLVRVELVDPENTARKKLLQSLVSLPPRWEAPMGGEAPPQLAQTMPHFQPPLQTLQTIPTTTPIPVYTYAMPTPQSTSPSIPPFSMQSSPMTAQQQQHMLSHTAPAFIPGRFASYLPSFTQPQSTPIPTQGIIEVHPTTPMMTETAPKLTTAMLRAEDRMNPISLWQLTQNPATRAQLQLHNNFPIPSTPSMLDPREGPKYSLFTTSSTVRAPPPPRTARDSGTERRRGSRRRNKSKSKKNQSGAGKSTQDVVDPSGRKPHLEALNVSKAKATSHPILKLAEGAGSPRTKGASPIMAPRTHPPTPPISQLTSPSSFPLLTQTSTPKTPKPNVPHAPFSVFESAPSAVLSTSGEHRPLPSSPPFQPSASFPQSYTTLSSSPKQQGGSPRRPWGRPWGKRGGRGQGRDERASPSGRPSGTFHTPSPAYYRG